MAECSVKTLATCARCSLPPSCCICNTVMMTFFDFHGTGSSEKFPRDGIHFTPGTICATGASTLATLPSYGRACVQSRTVDASIHQHSRARSLGRRRSVENFGESSLTAYLRPARRANVLCREAQTILSFPTCNNHRLELSWVFPRSPPS